MMQRLHPHQSSKDSSSTTGSTGFQSVLTKRKPKLARPRTAISSYIDIEEQRVICAISESRGVAPSVGMAFVNIDSCEAVICQLCDTQTYVKTLHKLAIISPDEILLTTNTNSKLYSVLKDSLEPQLPTIRLLDRCYWSEAKGLQYLEKLACNEDLHTLKVSIEGKYFATCSLAAALKYVENDVGKSFPFHAVRVRYEPPEGSMMIDICTIKSLELIQNARDPRSRHCLFGLMNETLTKMGARFLRNNILQPLTSTDTLELRYDAVAELANRTDMLPAVRQALKGFVDTDKLLTTLITARANRITDHIEENINSAVLIRQFISSTRPVFDAIAEAESRLLLNIAHLCSPQQMAYLQMMIDGVINEDIRFSKSPLDLRNQRTFAIRSGVNGLLDVARTTYKENCDDAMAQVADLSERYRLNVELKYDNTRQFYMALRTQDIRGLPLPGELVNVVRKKKLLEFSTLDLMKRNQKIIDSHNECLLLSDQVVRKLLDDVYFQLSVLLKASEGIAMLDVISGFAQLSINNGYVRPRLGDAFAVKGARHPIKESLQRHSFIPNDCYAATDSRFQVVTGCNMSGKSTYIRTVALMTVMAQVGSFVPAEYASFPVYGKLFVRASVCDSVEEGISTLASEMREMGFVLRNVDERSIIIVDEIGRGTSSQDGLALAIAVSELLLRKKAYVWFATHFTDLARAMAELSGVVSLQLVVEAPDPLNMKMLYTVAPGITEEEHYGLWLARAVALPKSLVDRAESVAAILSRNLVRAHDLSPAVVIQRRRRLVIGLREHLKLALERKQLDGTNLRSWLHQLQIQFVAQMSQLDANVSETVE